MTQPVQTTVTMSIAEYDSLRAIKKAFECGGAVFSSHYNTMGFIPENPYFYFIGKQEAIEALRVSYEKAYIDKVSYLTTQLNNYFHNMTVEEFKQLKKSGAGLTL